MRELFFPAAAGGDDGRRNEDGTGTELLSKTGKSAVARLASPACPARVFAMSTVQEIKAAIETLTPAERQELECSLRQSSSATEALSLPDKGARRRRIFGDRVLPNLVLEAREQERA